MGDNPNLLAYVWGVFTQWVCTKYYPVGWHKDAEDPKQWFTISHTGKQAH